MASYLPFETTSSRLDWISFLLLEATLELVRGGAIARVGRSVKLFEFEFGDDFRGGIFKHKVQTH